MTRPSIVPLTNIGKLAVLKDHKVMLLGQSSELVNQVLIKVLNNVNVGLLFSWFPMEKKSNMLVPRRHKKYLALRQLITTKSSRERKQYRSLTASHSKKNNVFITLSKQM
jgi:hypothetical protein